MQRQRGVLVFKEVVDRLQEFLFFAIGFGERKEAEFLERFDVGLRQGCQFFAAIDAFGLGFDALQRVSRERVVERPGMSHAR